MATNYKRGHDAEGIVANYLKSVGYQAIEMNWKTRWCEIDIIAKKDEVIYFVEVKYRKNIDYGYPIEYITPKKLEQMTLAAEIWVANHEWEGEYQLLAVEVMGDAYENIHLYTV